MDFLNKAYGQVVELLRGLTPMARITTGLLLAVLVVSLVYLFRFKTESVDHFLFGTQLTNREIAALELAFAQEGLNGWKTEGNRIMVPRSERDKYLSAAAQHNAVPENAQTPWSEVFEGYSPLDPRPLQDLREQQAKQRDLANTIRQLKGVEEAYVTIEKKDTGSLRRRTEKWALAAVRLAGTRSLDANFAKTVRNTVAAAAAVDRENVTVVDLNTAIAYPGHGKDGAPASDENVYAQNQRQFEQLFQETIENRLSYIQGAIVEVFVELDKTLKNETAKQEYQQGVQLRTKEYKKDSTSAVAEAAGRPGAVPNGVGNQGATVSTTPGPENTSNEERNEYERLPASTYTYREEVRSLVPKLVKASIAIPTSYFEKVWRTENPTPPGEQPQAPDSAALTGIQQREIKNIEDAVLALLPPPPPGDDPIPRVQVATYTPTPLPSPEGPTLTDTTTTWLGTNWQTLGMFVLALIGVIMLRSMIRSAHAAILASGEQQPQQPRKPLLPAEQLAELTAEEEEPEESDDDFSNSLKARFQTTGRSLRDELTELVREDPDAAANVLQNWIGDTAEMGAR